MRKTWKKLTFEALLLLCLPLAFTGCGGGGGSSAGTGTLAGGTTIISGIATKGPIKGASVAVFQLLVSGARGTLLGQGTSGAGGAYAIAIPTLQASGPLLITVTGNALASYTSESKGADVPFGATESFNAVVESGSANRKITVSPLTEEAFQKLPQILAASPGPASSAKLANAVLAANARIGSLYNVADILADPAGDIVERTVLLILDQMVEDSKASGVITNTSAVMTLLRQGLTDITQPAYQAYLQVFNTAADKVKLANPGLIASIVDALKIRASAPPVEPDFTDVTPPSTPVGLAATTFAIDASTSSVVLSWSPATDNIAVTGYQVFRNGSRIATVTSPGFTDIPVTSNVTFSYTVLAFDAVGNRSPASAPLLVTPNQASLNVIINGQISSDILGLPAGDVVAPSAPTNLNASTTALTATTSSVVLNWGASTDNLAVTGYEVFRNGVKIGTVATPGFLDPSVTSNVTFTYFVLAFDAAGNRSTASNQLQVTPNQASLGVIVNGQITP